MCIVLRGSSLSFFCYILVHVPRCCPYRPLQRSYNHKLCPSTRDRRHTSHTNTAHYWALYKNGKVSDAQCLYKNVIQLYVIYVIALISEQPIIFNLCCSHLLLFFKFIFFHMYLILHVQYNGKVFNSFTLNTSCSS